DLTGRFDQPRRLAKPIHQNTDHSFFDLLSSQSPALGVLRSWLGDQRSGDVIAIMSALLDHVRGRKPLPSGIDQQAGEQARLGRFGPSLMIASIACDLVPHRGPGLSIDQCRMLAWVKLVFVSNLTGV